MNVGVDIRSLHSTTGRGVSHYALSLLKELVRTHPEDSWHLLQTGRRPYVLPPELDLPNVQLHRVALPNKLLNLTLGTVGRPLLDAYTGPVDVFFAPNLGFIRLSRSVPLVMTVHDVSFAIEPRWFSAKERLWHRAISPRRLLRRANKIITISKQTQEELGKRFDVPRQKMVAIHSGIDDAYRQPVAEKDLKRVRQRYDLPADYVLFMGAAEPRKNIATMVMAYRRARERGLKAELVLAGSISPAAQGLFQTAEPIHLLGYVKEADKPALYAAAQTLMLVSLHEGFGFPPLEALACGTPSLVSDIPVFHETLKKAALKVNPDDAETMAADLVHLEGEPIRTKQILAAGEPVVAALTWQRTAAATYEILRQASEEEHA